MKTRKPASRSVEKEVLVSSRRRCCLCVFLNNLDETCRGQIAHLNRDRSDSRFENLVFLCLKHHDEYDTKTTQSKAFLPEEVQEYRERLYRKNGEQRSEKEIESIDDCFDLMPLLDVSEYEIVRKQFAGEFAFLSSRWRFPLWQVSNQPDLFAYKAKNRSDGICLIERIDLPDGRIVIACIEIAGNPGLSITNGVEELCFQVCERFSIPTKRLVWLEHYDYFEPPALQAHTA
jgi:hypothetical protein